MTWIVKQGGQYMINGKRYTDPIQGMIPNCSFIAGIASIAWVNPNLIPSLYQGIAGGLRYYQFRFYPNPGSQPGSVNASEKVETGGASSSDTYELWPSLYEKAYVKWKSVGSPTGPLTVDEIDLNSIPWTNSESIMQHLTGRSYSTEEIRNYTSNQIQDLINQKNPLNNAIIAWTYPDTPLSGEYNDNIIKADHAYSVLGVHPSDVNYVLLRNPYGPSRGDPTDATIVLTTGPVQLPNKPIIYLSTTTDGIFALHVATFQTHFAKLAYTAG